MKAKAPSYLEKILNARLFLDAVRLVYNSAVVAAVKLSGCLFSWRMAGTLVSRAVRPSWTSKLWFYSRIACVILDFFLPMITDESTDLIKSGD